MVDLKKKANYKNEVTKLDDCNSREEKGFFKNKSYKLITPSLNLN